MSWSLQIRNGDFTTTGAQLGIATGHQKVAQDLAHWVLEPMGTDNLHIRYGSLIDGGMENGMERPSMIGLRQDDSALLKIRAEISRILQDYRSTQFTRAKSDRFAFKNATLTKDEILYEINGIIINPKEDTVTVTIEITTGRNDPIQISVPVQASV